MVHSLHIQVENPTFLRKTEIYKFIWKIVFSPFSAIFRTFNSKTEIESKLSQKQNFFETIQIISFQNISKNGVNL